MMRRRHMGHDWLSRSLALVPLLFAAACVGDIGDDDDVAADGGVGVDGGSGGDAGMDGIGIEVTSFPFHDIGDTSAEPPGIFDFYGCAPDTDESGPEVIYHVVLSEAGFLSAAVYEDFGVDVDIHILSDLDPEACLERGNLDAAVDVEPGEYWIVIDTYAGMAMAGGYEIDIGFTVPSRGACDLEVGTMPRVGDGGDVLAMPATGPIVMEAHLVTQEEPAPYPSTATEELDEHYALSQAGTGFVMRRFQVWAPLEGASFYGGGIGSPADFPLVDEGWYVNMYWTASARPAKGTRMILRDPDGGSRAVVVAAGYETGPGNLAHIGGTPEETHFYMGTSHLSPMTLGIAVEQALPLGPRVCE